MILSLLIFILAFSGQAPWGAGTTAEHRVWISPNMPGDFPGLFEAQASWPTVKAGVDVFKFYIDAVNKRRVPAEEAVEILNDANIAIAVEAGGLRNWECSGARMAEIELKKISPIFEAGGHLSYLALDSPFGHTLATGKPNPCQYTVEEAAAELLTYIKAVRQQHPDVKLGLIEPVPWYTVGRFSHNPGNNFGDLPELLDTALGVLEHGGETLDFFHADSPYDFNEALRGGRGWAKLKALQDVVRSRGLRFGLIYNSARGGQTSDELFYTETLDGYRKFAQVGGDPDDLIVQSWYPLPSAVLPEDQPYTFTFLVREFLGQLR